MISPYRLLAACGVPTFVLCLSSAVAAPVTWGSANNIIDDSDILVSGTLVGAFNVGDGGVAAATVNGVTFAPFALNSTGGPVSSGTIGDFTLATADLFLSDNAAYGSTSAPFTTLSVGYRTLLASATITSAPATFTLTISGLTIGDDYRFQWFCNQSGPGSQAHRAASTGGGISILDNESGAEGGTGQFAIGSFVADSASQIFTFSGLPNLAPNFALLNAFQLRNLSVVPEPGSGVLTLLGLGVVARKRRRSMATR